jgi:predicted RNase H-like HicB family nuclease
MKKILMKHDYYVIIERYEDGYYVGEVPQLKACYSQGRTIDELLQNIKEAIELCLEDEKYRMQNGQLKIY